MAVSYPHESLVDSHVAGCTEPYVAEAICALLKASDQRNVLETGSFIGTTSAWLALALESMGGGTLACCEIDTDRALGVHERLSGLNVPNVAWSIPGMDIFRYLTRIEDKSIGLVFVDDDHQKHHVEQEINALWPKMKPGGLMLFHDVASDGVCQLGPLIRKYGGIALDLPRLGPDGGLGIIPIPA